MNTFSFNGSPLGIPAIAITIIILHAIVAILLALAVWADAAKRESLQRELFLVSPPVWGLVTLMSGGLIGTVAYWLIHYSAQRGPAYDPKPHLGSDPRA